MIPITGDALGAIVENFVLRLPETGLCKPGTPFVAVTRIETLEHDKVISAQASSRSHPSAGDTKFIIARCQVIALADHPMVSCSEDLPRQEESTIMRRPGGLALSDSDLGIKVIVAIDTENRALAKRASRQLIDQVMSEMIVLAEHERSRSRVLETAGAEPS